MPTRIRIKDKSQQGQLIKTGIFKSNIRKTEPHKHNDYFEIIYLSKGSGSHTIDHKRYAIKAPVIFFVRKEQVHHWDLKTMPKGYVLLLKRGFVDKSVDRELKILLSKVSSLSCLQTKDSRTLELLFETLTRVNNFTVEEGLLKALLATILENARPIMEQSKMPGDLFLSFRELLSQTSEIRNSVAHYAALLKSTPQNLNAVCRKTVNQSAAAVLSEHIIGEAKRLLLYTGNTTSEIAFALDFTDASHFIKYFKRYIGQTPNVFRNS